MLVSLGCLILGRKRSDRFFLFWMVLFTLAFFLELLVFCGKISICGQQGEWEMSFGENLKKARLAAGLTQTELAKRTGVTERSIYNYEKNSRAPKIDVAERFAQVLGVPAESLLELETAAPQDSVAKALAQAQAVFESGLPRRSKELFFEQIALAYFRSQQQNIGETDDAM